ncbi:hypothetical protein [Lysinibacillus varians]|uniref:hypothetical protein n=1 Tax=Lysinibacillus varians TaxID=1145276 RepID=UPI00042E6EBC|nr:hypothetical protein [Lysinibacillus varians]AHN24377.1 hypothetical protein T479_16430 [Lysinibacillus varians]
MEDNKKSSQVVGATSEAKILLLLNVIEQGVQSILIRDKYIRVLLTVQILLILSFLFN